MPLDAVLHSPRAARIRHAAPETWGEFAVNWMDFNAIYGGMPDGTERRRAMAAVRQGISRGRARQILRNHAEQIQAILNVPPGDMRLDSFDPNFRRRSRQLARQVRSGSNETDQLAGLGGILYQIRCNLLHGEKDPASERDIMLVENSVSILASILDALDDAA